MLADKEIGATAGQWTRRMRGGMKFSASHLDIVVRKVIGDAALVGPVLRPVALVLPPGPGAALLSRPVIGQ